MDSTLIDVVAWIWVRDKRILCARTTGKDSFYLPGGKREHGETDCDALCREVKEELDVSLIAETVTEATVVQEIAHGYIEPTDVIMRCFEASYIGEITPNAEIEEIAWLNYADLEQCAPATQRVVYQHQRID